jgi:hypothetical protein
MASCYFRRMYHVSRREMIAMNGSATALVKLLDESYEQRPKKSGLKYQVDMPSALPICARTPKYADPVAVDQFGAGPLIPQRAQPLRESLLFLFRRANLRLGRCGLLEVLLQIYASLVSRLRHQAINILLRGAHGGR